MPDALSGYSSFHAWLSGWERYRGQIGAFSFFPPRSEGDSPVYEGGYAPLLEGFGIRPYRHQVETLLEIEAGGNVVVATPTASGKSLGYQVPTLQTLADGGTALYLFPTKALARDQLEKLVGLATPLGLATKIAAYDGDTPASLRYGVRERAGCLFTNPDMLHYGILPHHARWARFLGALKLIVIDELHAYRGVMGTHVANLLRRLLRVVRHYGAAPQVVAASATVGNPAEHARNLTGLEFAAVREDFGPRAARELLFWSPPLLPGDDGRRRSANSEAADLAALFVRTGLKSLFFCNSRRGAELLRRYAAGLLGDEAERLGSYRAGYAPEDRRKIEARFRQGDLRVLIATSALELGVDVGGVDAVVLVGYPGSLTAFRQRAGRAGRGKKRALTLLIPGNDPLDEYYLHHPGAITEGRAEHAVADAFNTELHPLHLACAAYEVPLEADEALVGHADLENVPGLVRRGERWGYRGAYPHSKLSLRGSGGGRVTIKDGTGRHMGSSDLGTALRELHPGAVYLHQGDAYLVRNLDLEHGLAILLPHIEDHYTQARSVAEVETLAQERTLFGPSVFGPSVFGTPVAAPRGASHLPGARGVFVGRVRVTTNVTSYVRKRLFTEAVLDERPLELPEVSYPTQALWFGVREVVGAVPPALLPDAMHALEHTLIGLLPAFVLCERADVGGVSYPIYPPTGEPVIFIYDGYPGGVGYAHAGALLFPEWLRAARDLLRDCPCKDGCPRCILSPKCGNGNQSLDKGAALALAEALLRRLEC